MWVCPGPMARPSRWTGRNWSRSPWCPLGLAVAEPPKPKATPLDGGQENAAGGGGGGFVLPLGVYSRNASGQVAFRPNTIALLAGLAPLVCAVGYTVRGILRAQRR